MARGELRVALDSSYLIALLSHWHDKHEPTLQSYQHWKNRAHIILPVHAILECYSVLTRIPPPYRLASEVARQIIEENFRTTTLIAEAKADALWQKLQTASDLGIRGGQVYDALIAWSAAEAGASVLLTWNIKHFALLGLANFEAREP